MAYLFISLVLFFQTNADTTYGSGNNLNTIKLQIVEGDRKGASQSLKNRVQEGNPGEEELQLLLGLYHQDLNFSELINLYETHKEKLDENAGALFSYGQALHQTGFTERAVRVLEKLRSLEADDNRGLILLGNIYYSNEKWEEANLVYNELMGEMPENLHFRTQLAKVNSNLRETDYARQLLNDVLEENPNYLPAILELSITHIAANELYKARELIDPALELYPEQDQLWRLSARIAYNLQEFEKAISQWQKLIELGEADSNTFRGSGLSYYQLGNAEKAIENFDQALALNPEDMISLYYSAMVYRQNEDWEKAESVLNNLFNIQITDYFSDTIMQRAVVTEELGKIENSKNDYRLVKLIDPDHPSADFYLAGLYDRHSDDSELIIEYYENFLNSEHADTSFIGYARGRLSVLREKLHFERGRE